MLRATILLLIALFGITPAAAQRSLVGGFVVDENGIGIPGAHVYFEDKLIGTMADREGCFAVELRPGAYTFVSSAVGYQTHRRPLPVAEGHGLRIVLEEAIIDAGEVVVTAARRPQLAREVPSS